MFALRHSQSSEPIGWRWPLHFQARDGQHFQLRPAGYADQGRLIANIDTIAAEGDTLQTTTFVRDANWAAVLEQGADVSAGRLLLVAVCAERLVGHLRVFPGPYGARDRHVGSVGLAVVASQRGIGIGTALLTTGMRWATGAGFAKLEANVAAGNARSIQLFVRQGFAVEAVRRRQLRFGSTDVDELILVRFAGDAQDGDRPDP